MAEIRFNYPTTLPLDQIQARLNRLVATLSREANIKAVWRGSTLYISGKYAVVTINAMVAVATNAVVVVADDPGWPFRGKAESYLKGRLALYLNPQVPLQKLP